MSLFNSILFRFFFSIFLVQIFWSCNSYRLKLPIFTSNVDSVKEKINKIIHFQDLTFDGSEESINSEKITKLRVRIINTPITLSMANIPQVDSALQDLGRHIVLELINNLRDPYEFISYQLDFTQNNSNLLVSKITRFYYYELRLDRGKFNLVDIVPGKTVNLHK
jgi:hypothetical protein